MDDDQHEVDAKKDSDDNRQIPQRSPGTGLAITLKTHQVDGCFMVIEGSIEIGGA